MERRLTYEQCWDLLVKLFPNGLQDQALVQELAPEGREQSPLVRVSRPTAEQLYEEAHRIRKNLASLTGRLTPRDEHPTLALDTVPGEVPIDVPKQDEECAELLGRCLWDIFSDNHDVLSADGAQVHLGSFQSMAAFISDFWTHQVKREERLHLGTDYTTFYMGTVSVCHRADLTPVYELIFRRMHQQGLDWHYVHPRMMVIDLGSLGNMADGESEAVRYDPTESYWRERELGELQRTLDEAYQESVEKAQRNPPPTTVSAFYTVYGRWPAGWPPEVEP